jgi:fructose-specific phosphotransferase system IIC component
VNPRVRIAVALSVIGVGIICVIVGLMAAQANHSGFLTTALGGILVGYGVSALRRLRSSS